jgi:hypothetical protein
MISGFNSGSSLIHATQARQVLLWGQEATQARQVLLWGQEAIQARQVPLWDQEANLNPVGSSKLPHDSQVFCSSGT